ncbi:MAG: DUF2480 family protein [Bacteroidetes bacterium]|nr:DUF2480 family protein [Bacteroidota bacterium]
MAVQGDIINRVTGSGLVTLNLEDYAPSALVEALDIAPVLFQGLILREKDFREWVKTHNWQAYAGKQVALHCSADAIIPAWAWMLAGCELAAVGAEVALCTPAELTNRLWTQAIRQNLPAQSYAGQRIVLKGCGTVPPEAYLAAAHLLRPVVLSLMFGEPCSTVPIYKRAKAEVIPHS